MNIGVVSLFPELFEPFLEVGVIGKAFKKGLATMILTNPREFSLDKHQTVDDRPYGGGDGMVLRYDEFAKSVECLKKKMPTAKVVYMSPSGTPFNSLLAKEFSLENEVILVCGRYGGIDQRFIERWVDEEISMGDYVVSGGEGPAMSFIDALLRFVPGVLGHAGSAEFDSFSNGLLESPCYTRSNTLSDINVPDVLLSGNHKEIEKWKEQMSLARTKKRRPDLLEAWARKKKGDLEF